MFDGVLKYFLGSTISSINPKFHIFMNYGSNISSSINHKFCIFYEATSSSSSINHKFRIFYEVILD